MAFNAGLKFRAGFAVEVKDEFFPVSAVHKRLVTTQADRIQ
jgi:hypothetical protein